MQKSSLVTYTLFLCTIIVCASCKQDNVVKPSAASTSSEFEQFEEVEATAEAKISNDKKEESASTEAAELKKVESEKVTQKPVKKVQKKKPTTKKTTPKKKKKKIAKKKPRPIITFEEPNQEFGEIVEGDTIDFKFVFVNTGTAPLDIESAIPTCGCTRPSFPFIAVEPGDKGYIGVQFISLGKEGVQNPSIEVNSNGSTQPVFLTMSGFVNPKPKEEPAEVDSTELKTGN